jgi:hypothetical protein
MPFPVRGIDLGVAELLEVLLRAGARPTVLDRQGFCALDWAIVCRRFGAAEQISIATSLADKTAFIGAKLRMATSWIGRLSDLKRTF